VRKKGSIWGNSPRRKITVMHHRSRPHTALMHFLYRHVFKPIVFQIDPEKIHDSMIDFGESLGKYRPVRRLTGLLFDFQHAKLSQRICGIEFRNPVGLSGGFDKNGRLTDILPAVGFGFLEIGSITGERCEGNLKPRMWRLKKSRSLLVHYGLNNAGARAIAKRLRGKKFSIPVGINIAKTNNKETVAKEAGTADYVRAYRAMSDIGDYVTINISCPNAYGGCPFTDRDYLSHLLAKIAEIPKTKPIFLKLSPDLTPEEIRDIIALARRFQLDGFVCANLTKPRENPHILDSHFPAYGGMSGKVVEALSNDLIETVFRQVGKEFVIIGVGGVFSAEDAYQKIRRGASLVQLITGMVFEGPQLIGDINHGLVALLKRDGYQNISEAIGVDARS
jgi:dihydroorotate dehydrogenase